MKKRPSKFISVILVIAVILILTFLPGSLLDRLFLPWAFDRTDHLPLPGVWVGTLTTATGRQSGVVLEMYLPEPKGRKGLRRDWRNAPYGELEDTLRMCDESGLVRSYTIEGNPEDRKASRMHLYATPVEKPAPEGLTPNWSNGTWDSANKLNFTVNFHWEKDGAAISGGDYPDTQADASLEMTRGGETEFQAICAQMDQ
jgi:hypothetical protein